VGAKTCPLSDACALGDGALERALAREAELRRAVEEERGVVLFVRTCAELPLPTYASTFSGKRAA
jgi:hypothetical protein